MHEDKIITSLENSDNAILLRLTDNSKVIILNDVDDGYTIISMPLTIKNTHSLSELHAYLKEIGGNIKAHSVFDKRDISISLNLLGV